MSDMQPAASRAWDSRGRWWLLLLHDGLRGYQSRQTMHVKCGELGFGGFRLMQTQLMLIVLYLESLLRVMIAWALGAGDGVGEERRCSRIYLVIEFLVGFLLPD